MVVNYGLRREIKPIILFGLPELQLMIEEILLNTTSAGRAMGVMRIIELLLLCFTAVRPSSLGPANPEMLEQGKVSLSSPCSQPKSHLHAHSTLAWSMHSLSRSTRESFVMNSDYKFIISKYVFFFFPTSFH